jgi:hypothetical protein
MDPIGAHYQQKNVFGVRNNEQNNSKPPNAELEEKLLHRAINVL